MHGTKFAYRSPSDHLHLHAQAVLSRVFLTLTILLQVRERVAMIVPTQSSRKAKSSVFVPYSMLSRALKSRHDRKFRRSKPKLKWSIAAKAYEAVKPACFALQMLALDVSIGLKVSINSNIRLRWPRFCIRPGARTCCGLPWTQGSPRRLVWGGGTVLRIAL